MPRTTKSKSNVERVTEYMEYGSPLNQCFVIEALTKWAEATIKNKAQIIASLENSMISGPAWIQCAENWLASNR